VCVQGSSVQGWWRPAWCDGLGNFRDLTEQSKPRKSSASPENGSRGPIGRGVAHDFNNLLNNIDHVSCFRCEPSDSADFSDNLNILDKTIQRGATLTRQLYCSLASGPGMWPAAGGHNAAGNLYTGSHLLGTISVWKTDLRSMLDPRRPL